jgi:hypothetical protein
MYPAMTKKRSSRCSVIQLIALISCVLLSRGTVLQAQQLAALNVTVTDPSNRVVSGAQITLTSAETSLTRTQSTDHAEPHLRGRQLCEPGTAAAGVFTIQFLRRRLRWHISR